MKALLALLLTAVISCLITAAQTAEEVKPLTEKPLVQMAILLDTSNSMDGLIEQAKAQLWNIVSEFAVAKRNGITPDLHVALYQYGNDNIPASEGHIRLMAPLTNDLDKISEELFALKTCGGQEYCGMVIKHATENLEWSKSNDVYKVIFIAGNEPFTQGSVNYKEACEAAIAKGIIVNTIHCGSEQDGINGKWKDGADLADGKYMIIDHNSAVVHIDAPQDAEIIRLSEELNKTYIPFGKEGKKGALNQIEQDMNASKYGDSYVAQRAIIKSKEVYNNASWDLVDAVNHSNLKLENVDEKELPENMQKMTKEEREKYVTSQNEARKKFQEQINKLNNERGKYIAEETKKLKEKGENTLGVNIINTIREQAEKKNFEFKQEK